MEEKQDDLDNLIIKSKKPSGLKKILLAAAILLLVLILIILVTKSLIEDENRPSSSVILPPEPITQPSEPAKEPLFEQVPIEEENGSEKRIEQAAATKEEKPKTGEVSGKYFIQVGAFFRYPPDRKFLDSITLT